MGLQVMYLGITNGDLRITGSDVGITKSVKGLQIPNPFGLILKQGDMKWG